LLVQLIRQRRVYDAFTPKRPTDWRPRDVQHPGSFLGHFTSRSAWEFIAKRLQKGVAVEEVLLRRPKGGLGFEFTAHLEGATEGIYVKIELSRGRNRVFGRSFHPSYRTKGVRR